MKILKTDQELSLIPNNVEIYNELPVGIYTLGYHPMKGQFLLHEQNYEEFKVPSKLYGNAGVIAERVISTYERRNRKMGLLLHGEKGTGKSIISKIIINKLNIPVIVVKEFFENSTALESFLNELKTPVVLFIDEFEKIYSNVSQQSTLLSIMDGTGQSDILFLLTSNSNSSISEFLKNRPGRIFYSINFEGLDKQLCDEVIDEMLTKPEKKQMIQKALTIIGSVNFDVLTSIIDEVNNVDVKDVNDLLYFMNVEPSSFTYEMVAKLKSNPDFGVYMSYITRNPLTEGVRFNEYVSHLGKKVPVYDLKKEEKKGIKEAVNIRLSPGELQNLKVDDDLISFENDEMIFHFTKINIKKLVY